MIRPLHTVTEPSEPSDIPSERPSALPGESVRAAPAVGFAGAVVAQFETRLSAQMQNLVRRQGGRSWLAPALSEVPVADSSVAAVLHQLADGEFAVVILLTGVGTGRLLDEAAPVGLLPSVRSALTSATTVCRGPKPAFALRKHGIPVRHLVPEPHTTAELLRYLDKLSLAGSAVLVVSAGERFAEPESYLKGRGATPTELQLYRWDLDAEARTRLSETVAELTAGRIDVAAFTTQVQVRHLFQVASETGSARELAAALNTSVLTGAVGPTCAAALEQVGVRPDVVPQHPRLGHLVVELARTYSRFCISRALGNAGVR